ncbi:MAG: FAD-dependent oxidoreductase [Pseudomonadota bacterium]
MPSSKSHSSKPRVVIIGANFAGLRAAAQLSCRHRVTVLDAMREFEWTPNIHEILSGVKRADGVKLPFGPAVARYGHEFVQARVSQIDVDAQQVISTDGRCWDYDACIVAAGSEGASFGIPGVEEHAMKLRRVADAERISAELDRLGRRKRPASVVVVGGGITGIETVGEILRRRHRNERFEIRLLEQEHRLLSQQPRQVGADAAERCEAFGVDVLTGVAVESVQAKTVVLQNGQRLKSDLCIWTAGLALPAFLRGAALNTSDDRWLPVRDTLQSQASDALFVAGDSAALREPIAKQAYHAMDMGELAGSNVGRFLRGRPLKDFRPSRTPTLIAFGDVTTWLVAGNSAAASPLLAAGKEAVYLATMAQLDSPWRPVGYTARLASRASRATFGLLLPQLNLESIVAGAKGSRIMLG